MLSRVAISQSKDHTVGLVGIEVMNDKIFVRLIRNWSRDERSKILENVKCMLEHRNRSDDNTTVYIDQKIGQYSITRLEALETPIKIITTERNSRDNNNSEKIEEFDIYAMVPSMIDLIQNGQLVFEPFNDSLDSGSKFETCIEQITKDDDISDGLSRALLIACFFSMNYIKFLASL